MKYFLNKIIIVHEPKNNRNIKMTSPISSNYMNKIQQEISFDEELSAKLEVSTSWHRTIITALDRAKILKGEFDPYKVSSINRLKEQYEERFETHNKDEEDEFYTLLEQSEHDEKLKERLEMWLEKMDSPGRKLLRGSDESAINILLREKAMKEIKKMSAKEFQTRLLDGTLPDFPREEHPSGLMRDTCHFRRLLTEEDFARSEYIMNYAQAHKDKLRYMSADEFKQLCYEEFE